MGFFDDILAKAPAEDQAILNKYPDLRASMTKLETDNAAMAPYAAKSVAWDEWRDKNWDGTTNMTHREKTLADELASANARLAAAGAGSGVASTEIARLERQQKEALEALKTETGKQLGGMKYFFDNVAKRLGPHRDEFHENFDGQALYDFMTKNGIADANVGYDQMMAPKRQELAAKKAQEDAAANTAAIEAAKLAGIEEGRQKALQERAMGPQGYSPTDQSGGIAGVTAHVGSPIKVSDEAKAAIAAAKGGTGELANLGYAAFLRGELGPLQ